MFGVYSNTSTDGWDHDLIVVWVIYLRSAKLICAVGIAGQVKRFQWCQCGSRTQMKMLIIVLKEVAYLGKLRNLTSFSKTPVR